VKIRQSNIYSFAFPPATSLFDVTRPHVDDDDDDDGDGDGDGARRALDDARRATHVRGEARRRARGDARER